MNRKSFWRYCLWLSGAVCAQIKQLRSELKRTTKDDDSQDLKHEASVPMLPKDAKRPFQHPYYWVPFIMIGNWH